jgi:hypothetical protein
MHRQEHPNSLQFGNLARAAGEGAGSPRPRRTRRREAGAGEAAEGRGERLGFGGGLVALVAASGILNREG